MPSDDAATALSILTSAVVPLAGAAAWLVGWVSFGLGGPTAPFLRFAVFAVGVALGSGVNASIGALQAGPTAVAALDAMVALAFPLAGVIGLAMTGRRRAAGLLLAGAALPWTLTFTTYIVDILTGADWSVPTTIALWLAGLVPLVIGSWLVVAGDPLPWPDPGAPAGRPGSRRLGSLSAAILRDATYGTPGPGLVLGVAAWAVSGLVLPGQPIAAAAMAFLAFGLGTEAQLRWLPPAARPAIEGFHAVGRGELARFEERLGQAVPRSLKALDGWLRATPETDLTRPFRVEVLTALGRLDEAAAELDRLVPDSPEAAFRRAALASDLGWRRGGTIDVAALRAEALAAGPEGSAERRLALGQVAWQEAEARLAALDPGWRAPLAAVRGATLDAAGLHARSMRRATLVGGGVLMAALVAVGLVLDWPPAGP